MPRRAKTPGPKDSIRAALQSLTDDGSYEQILMKYNVPGTAIPKATINASLD
ncbi:hypothetical protein [Streptomyces sp. NPDC001919]